jgi:hypothetical protein
VLTMDSTLLARGVVRSELRTGKDLLDRIGGGAGPRGVKAVAPVGTERISLDVPEAVSEVSLLGEKLTVLTTNGTETFTSAQRPIAVVSNINIDYQPAQKPPAKAAAKPPARKKRQERLPCQAPSAGGGVGAEEGEEHVGRQGPNGRHDPSERSLVPAQVPTHASSSVLDLRPRSQVDVRRNTVQLRLIERCRSIHCSEAGQRNWTIPLCSGRKTTPGADTLRLGGQTPVMPIPGTLYCRPASMSGREVTLSLTIDLLDRSLEATRNRRRLAMPTHGPLLE